MKVFVIGSVGGFVVSQIGSSISDTFISGFVSASLFAVAVIVINSLLLVKA